MQRPRTFLKYFPLLAMPLCAACFAETDASSSQTPSNSASSGSFGSMGTVLGSLEERCGGIDLTGRMALERAGAEARGTLEPAPSGASTSLRLGITYAGGPIRCATRTYADIRGASMQVMPNMLWVTVELTVASDDGSFVDRAPGVIGMREDGAGATFFAEVPVASRRGTFEPNLAEPGLSQHRIVFNGDIAGGALRGSVREQALTEEGRAKVGYEGALR